MGPMKLYFDVRDIFRAPRMALSGKKIFIFTAASFIGYVAYWLLAYFALGVSGTGFSIAWSTYGLYPFIGCSILTLFGKILYWIGTLILFYAISLACTAVARVTYKQFKGDEFYSAGDAFKFVKKLWHPIVFTWVSFVLIILVFLMGAAVFALFGYIPYIGEFLFAIPYLMYFFGSLFVVYTAVVFLISFIYTPAIVAIYEEDTMGSVFQSYSLTWSQPWRILLYHGILIPIAMLGIYLFKYFWFASYKLVNAVFGMEWVQSLFGLNWFTSGKLADIANWAWTTVNPYSLCVKDAGCASSHCCNEWSCCTWFDMSVVKADITLNGTEYIAGIILAFFLFLLVLSVISYGLSILSVGEALMFVIFKKKSDDDNLLERKDEEDLEEEDDDEFADESELDENEESSEENETSDPDEVSKDS